MTSGKLTLAPADNHTGGAVRIDEQAGHLPQALCLDQIARIAGSVTFARAEQIRELLLWLGRRSLERTGPPPSEGEIAQVVLRRADFDPRTDALVRKEMGRLREKLARYYLTEGLRDLTVVKANTGYLLKFERRHPAASGACWLVLPFRAGGETEDTANEFLDELLMDLQEMGVSELVSPAIALSYRGRVGDPRQFASECGAHFVVEGSLRRKEEGYEAIVWLVDGVSGRTQRSKRLGGGDPALLAATTARWLMEMEDH